MGGSVPIAYGRVRVVPPVVRIKQGIGSIQTSMYHTADFGVVLSEGPIDAIESWRTYDGKTVGATVDPAQEFAQFDSRLGTLSQTAIGFAEMGPLFGVAHAATRGRAGRATYPCMTIRGRVMYDPRLGAWGAGEYPAGASCAWSANPALEVADILTNPHYGPRIPPGRINWQSFADVADICDVVTGGEKTWECHLYLREKRSSREWIDTILLHFGGVLSEANGVWSLRYDGVRTTPDATFTDADMVPGTPQRVSDATGAGMADIPNRVTVEWTDPTTWTLRTVSVTSADVDAGAAVREGDPYRLHGLQSEKAAQRAAARILGLARSNRVLECTVWPKHVGLGVGAFLSITSDRLGLIDSEWIATDIAEAKDGTLAITAKEYDASAFSATGTGDPLPDDGFFGTPPALASVARSGVDSEVTAVTPTSKTTVTYLGFSWQLPVFSWPGNVVIRTWPHGTGATWDTAGYTELVVPANGDPAFAAAPTWKAFCRPIAYDTTVRTYGPLGDQINEASTGAGFRAILKLRSLAGVYSTGVSVSEAAHSSTTPTPSDQEPVLMEAGLAIGDGQIPIWDSVTGEVTFPGALAVTAPGSSATIGGRLLIGVTVLLAADVTAGATSIQVNRNTLVSGDRIMLEGAPGGVAQTEFMAVTSAPSGAGPYTYSVTRNLDGSGANAWKRGDAVFSTGQAGAGFVDVYSLRGVKSSGEVGPAIVGNVRNSATWNDWTPRWAVGNLKGLYGYAADTYGAAFGVPSGPWLKIDPTNGIRIGHDATTKVQVDASGNASFKGALTAASGTIGGWKISADRLSAGGLSIISHATPAWCRILVGTGLYNDSGTPLFIDGSGRLSLKNKLTWDGSALTVTGTIEATAGHIGGVTMAASKIYTGVGTWGNANTPFYVGSDGSFALGASITWDGANLFVNAYDVTIDSNGITIPTSLDTATCYGFRSGSTFKGGLWSPGTSTIQVGCAPSGPRLGFDPSSGAADFWDCKVRSLTGFTTQTNVPGDAEFNATSGYAVNGTKVVGAQGAAVANASATLASLQSQLNALLARLRAHGLIYS